MDVTLSVILQSCVFLSKTFCVVFYYYFFIRIFILDETLQLFRLAVITVCPVLVPSELLLSTHLPASEGWTAELAVGLWLVAPTTGSTRVDLA